MSHSTIEPPFDQFLVTAEEVARQRPELDPELAREIFEEVATMLYNGLALDGLDEHDTEAVIAGLCVDLVDGDPGAAVRAHAEAIEASPGDLHDPAAVSAAYRISAAILQLESPRRTAPAGPAALRTCKGRGSEPLATSNI